MRKLRYHEKKLLKKVDFFSWETDNKRTEAAMMQKYMVSKREHYSAYLRLSRQVRTVCRKIRDLEPEDPFRIKCTVELLDKLYNMGIIPTKKNLELVDKVTASCFCRRRLPVILVKLKMAENIKAATMFVEQGHIRVGTQLILDPAYLVTRHSEDFVTWKETSKIRQHILEYNEEKDDFDLA